MSIFLWMAFEAFLFILIAGCFLLGYWLGKRQKPTPVKVDEETKRKAKELDEDFQAIMNYDLGQAMQRKKVI